MNHVGIWGKKFLERVGINWSFLAIPQSFVDFYCNIYLIISCFIINHTLIFLIKLEVLKSKDSDIGNRG